MSLPLEDYGLIGDTQTAALVGRDGSIDWLCLPRFDSGACFAALLGDPGHGRWILKPAAPVRAVSRRYRGDSLVLETEFDTDAGRVRLVDCMPPREREPDLVRVVEGVRGDVPMEMELVIRFDYGSIVPWVRTIDGVLHAVAGPDALALWAPVPTHGVGLTTRCEFVVHEGDRMPFLLLWHPSHEPTPTPIDAARAADDTRAWWEEWASTCRYEGEARDAVVRSLITLKALTYAPTGGIIAAPTTSLPERIGGVRNWDYRCCWLRDATFTLYALMIGGYYDEAVAWRNWLLRAVAGDPSTLQSVYGPSGERRLEELELPWLPGYQGSRPVRIGNAAVAQRQLDVYGEVMDMLHLARKEDVDSDPAAWALQKALMDFLESAWRQPDEGIWEVRGGGRHFTHSKVMAWVAMDRAVRAVEEFGLDGPVDRWKALRAEIHREVCERGFDPAVGAFTQSYGSRALDASSLLIPIVGFLPARDPRVLGTVAAIERELMRDGFVRRYLTDPDNDREGAERGAGGAAISSDGLPPDEGAFLACTFWLVDNYLLQDRLDEARAIFGRLLAVRNDLGLLSEEYDPAGKRLVGNFPQAFSHVALINTAHNLSRRRASRSAA